jgi:hypothetical protein
MARWRRSASPTNSDDLGVLARELRRLDPWSYWSGPAPEGLRADLVVAGVTGVFVVAACPIPGLLTTGRWGPAVSGSPITGISGAKSAAKRVSMTIDAAAVHMEAEPVVVLTQAVVGAPRTVRGVRVVGLDQVVQDLASHPIRLERGRAQRAAKVLGLRPDVEVPSPDRD